MIGTYWAQPEGQRIISHHSTKEFSALDAYDRDKVGPGTKPRRKIIDIKLIETFLEDGPKTRSELATFLGKRPDNLYAVESSMTYDTYRIYEYTEMVGNMEQVMYALLP